MNLREAFLAQQLNRDLERVPYRLEALNKLKQVLIKNQNVLFESLKMDLNKSESEIYLYEFSQVIGEVNYFLKKLKALAKPIKVKTPIHLFKSSSQIQYFPKGISLIISPWNYPLFLTFLPLIGNIAAGNKSILKLSEHSKFTSKAIFNLLSKNFDKKDLLVLEPQYDDYEELYSFPYNHIFFIGSEAVGRKVYQEAAKNLTSVTLELGGACPAIFMEDCNIPLSCKRLLLGKMLNSGQTCVSPNYLLVDEKIKDQVLKELIQVYQSFYPKGMDEDYYPKLIHMGSFQRQMKILQNEKILFGGETDLVKQKMGLTLIEMNDLNHPLFREESFGPILGIYSFQKVEEILQVIQSPLSIYLFTKNKQNLKKFLSVSTGTLMLNDTISNLGNLHLPFKGVGTSCLGMYRGKYSFYELSDLKVLYSRSLRFDIQLKYPPFNERNLKKMKRFL